MIAAVESFLRDTTPPPAAVPEGPGRWLSTARLEAVERAPAREPWRAG